MDGGSKIASRRAGILAQHLVVAQEKSDAESSLQAQACLAYEPPEKHAGPPAFNPTDLRKVLDHNLDVRDEIYSLLASNPIFRPKDQPKSGFAFTNMDYNTTKEEQRNITMDRILYLMQRGYFKGWLTSNDPKFAYEKMAMHEALSVYDHSIAIKMGVHFHLWGASIKYLGTKRHHDKYLTGTEDYVYAGCFALTELGHGSNVRGIETQARYDAKAEEFVITTPCESAQKYWIGGAAQHATHTVAFAQLTLGGDAKGVHAFVVPLRDRKGSLLPGIRILDCGHKMGLNGVDNGRIWFDNVRVPREDLLNAVSDVTPDGKYVSAIQDPDQRFAAFMSPLTGGRVTLSVSAINQCKIGLATALRYALSRRCFAPSDGHPELLILDYPSHQRRLLPLLAKTFAMAFAANELKRQYVYRTPADAKLIHVASSGYKALMTWHMSRTLQECREACGGQGFKTDNRIGQVKAEHDVLLTFEGDNHVLLQQVSKSLLADYLIAKKKGKPMSGAGLEHMNSSKPQLPQEASSAVLRDPNFQLALFRLRERDLLEKLTAQVSGFLKVGTSMFDALNQSYQLATELGKAHAERSILEACINGIAKTSGAVKSVLDLQRSLFVMTAVDEDPLFLRMGYITPEQAQAAHREVACLCADTRPHTLALVDSFGIPKHLLGPIAFDWVAYNSYDNELRRTREAPSAMYHGLESAVASSRT